jgi:hypothetical protein
MNLLDYELKMMVGNSQKRREPRTPVEKLVSFILTAAQLFN